MDEIDLIQDASVLAMDALLAERVRKAEAAARIVPPSEAWCDDCGCQIPAGRLKLVPTARLCVDCQTDLERVRR
jgi:DnaK suppressor protein